MTIFFGNMKYFKTLFLLIFLSGILHSQSDVDSLVNLLSNTKGRNRLALLNEIGQKYLKFNSLKCIEYNEQALKLAEEVSDNESKTIALKNLIQANLQINNYKTSINYAYILLKFYQLLGDKTGEAFALNRTGYIHLYLTEYDKGMENLIEAKKISETYKIPKELAVAENYLGIAYYILHQTDKAEEYCKNALEIFTDIKDAAGIIDTREHFGIIALERKKYDEALRYFTEVLDYRKTEGNLYRVISAQSNIGLTYLFLNEYDKAREIYESNLKIQEQLGNKKGMAIALARIGSIYRDKGDYKTALGYYLKSYEIGRIYDSRRGTIVTLTNIKNIYADFYHDYEKAYYYYDLLFALRDSVNRIENQEKVTEISQKYEVEKTAKILLEQRNLIYLLVGIIIFVFLFLFIIYIAYHDKKKINNILLEKNKFISEQQEKLQKINTSLKEAITAKNKLFSIISHDLRGNIGTLKSSLEFFSDAPNAEDKTIPDEFLKDLSFNAAEAYELLENLLNWSLSEQGHLHTNPAVHKVNDIIENNIRLLSMIAKKKSVTLKNQVDPLLTGFFDKSMILTVLRNLISNAIKFSKNNSEVIISTLELDNYIEIKIRDFGSGMSKSQVESIFDMKTKTIKPVTESGKGTGLGLSICYEFVKRNNGEMNIESEKGVGSVISFTVPKKSN